MINDSNSNGFIIIALAFIAVAVIITGSFSKLSPDALKLVETICVGMIGIAVGRGVK